MTPQARRTAIETFAAEARRYVEWAKGQSGEPMNAPTALRRIVGLYSAALALPHPFSEDLPADDVEKARVSRDDVRLSALHLPFRYYGFIADPAVMPPEKATVGDLLDDIGDIYVEVATGLELFDGGERAEALWEWGFGFRAHWGEHASAAIGALHGYLSGMAPEGLSAD